MSWPVIIIIIFKAGSISIFTEGLITLRLLYFALITKPNANKIYTYATQIVLPILHFVFTSDFDVYQILFVSYENIFSQNSIIISGKSNLKCS